MPGPVSDSYDPEFGTSSNCQLVKDEIKKQVDKIGELLGPRLKYIVSVCEGPQGKGKTLRLTEKELRVIRFALNRALETL